MIKKNASEAKAPEAFKILLLFFGLIFALEIIDDLCGNLKVIGAVVIKVPYRRDDI